MNMKQQKLDIKKGAQPVTKQKHNNGRFKAAMKVLFVEDWGLKIMALVFAAAVWVLFKVQVDI